MESLRIETPEVCQSCPKKKTGFKTCCETTPCAYAPDQFGQKPDEIIDNVHAAIFSGNAWLHVVGTFLGRRQIIVRAPSLKDNPRDILPSNTDIGQCTLLGPNGCQITDLESRPLSGAAYRPLSDDRCGFPKEVDRELNRRLSWKRYQRQLCRLAYELMQIDPKDQPQSWQIFDAK